MAVSQTGKARSISRKAPPAAPKAAPRKEKPASALAPAITPQDWQQRVATAAYLRAEARGFIGGSPEQDWLEAEAELMAKFGGPMASA
jgi:hypothetical protein